jgi:hypothetical protein
MSRAVKLIKIYSLIALLTVPTLISFAQPAMAIKGDRARFAACQQLKAQNSVRWMGIASGLEDSAHAIFENSRSFHTKACFATKQACDNWVKRIWWEIPTMDELRTAYCKPA